MKKVVLIFPDTIAMASFIFLYRISGTEVNSAGRSLYGSMTDAQLVIACTKYRAVLKAASSLYQYRLLALH